MNIKCKPTHSNKRTIKTLILILQNPLGLSEENIKAVLAQHNSSLDRVVKCTVILADINDFKDFNSALFPLDFYSRTGVFV